MQQPAEMRTAKVKEMIALFYSNFADIFKLFIYKITWNSKSKNTMWKNARNKNKNKIKSTYT